MTERNNSGGIGLAGILTIIFVIAKITGYIDWSWWWVFSPLWIGIAVALGFFFIVGAGLLSFAGIGIAIAGVLDWFDRR